MDNMNNNMGPGGQWQPRYNNGMYGGRPPKKKHTGDRSSVTLFSNGTARVTIDMGASETVSFNATYTSKKNGPGEYDDIVCTITLSGNTSAAGLKSNTFTFIIDPEVEDGMYAKFVEAGFGMIAAGSTFTK